MIFVYDKFLKLIGISLCHSVYHVEVCVVRVVGKLIDYYNEYYESNKGRKTCREHSVTLFFINCLHFLVVKCLIVCVLALKFFKLGTHFFHFKRVLFG